MASPQPDVQLAEPDVISIDDSDNEEPAVKDHLKRANVNGTSSSGAEEILQWRTTTVQGMKAESKKAFRAHWQLYEKNLIEWSERCLALQAENEGLKKNLLTAALVEMQGKETERQNLELEEKCKKLEEELEKARDASVAPNDGDSAHNVSASMIENTDETSDTPAPNAEAKTDTSMVDKLPSLHRHTADELRNQRQEVATLKSEMVLKEAKIEGLMKKLEAANARTTGNPAGVDGNTSSSESNAVAELQLVRAKLADVSEKLDTANTQKARLQEEIEEHEVSKNAMDVEMLALRDQYARVKEDLEWAENERNDVDEDIIYIMETSRLSLRDAFRKQKRDIEDLTRKLEEAREAVMLHQDDERDMTLQQEQLEDKLERLQDVNKSKQSRISALENEVKKLKQQMKQPRADHSSTAKSTQHREVEAKLRICESDKQALQEKLDDLEGVDAELKVLKKQFRLAEEKQQRMEKKETQLRTERNDVEKQFNSVSDGMEKRQRQIDRLTTELKEVQSLLKDKDVKIKGLDRRTTTLSAELQFSADAKIQLEEKVVALEEQLESLRVSLSFERELSARLKVSRGRAMQNDAALPNETPTRIRNRSVTPSVTPSSSVTSSVRKRGPELELLDEELQDIAEQLTDKIFVGIEGICKACIKPLKVGEAPAVPAKDRVTHLVEHHSKVLIKAKAAGITSVHKRPRTEFIQL